MAWTIMEDGSDEPLFDTETVKTIGREWHVVNAADRRASINVAVSGHAHLAQCGQEYLDEVEAAKESLGRSEVLRIINTLPEATRPPGTVRLSSNGRHLMA
jgi:hypothetical protein